MSFAVMLTGLRCAFQWTIALRPQLNVKNPAALAPAACTTNAGLARVGCGPMTSNPEVDFSGTDPQVTIWLPPSWPLVGILQASERGRVFSASGGRRNFKGY